MMDREQISKAKETLLRMAGGIDPIHGEVISDESFLNDPHMIRCFYDIAEVLEHVVQGTLYKRNNTGFHITSEQISRVILPDGNIGISDFARCVNSVLNIQDRKINSTELNRRLRFMKVLSESKDKEGRIRTTIGDQSHQFGFETEHRSYNGQEYDKIVINDNGKRFLLDNLESIMSVKAS